MSIDPAKTKVSKIMSKPLVAGRPRMDIEDTARLMFSKKIKKLPIVEEGRLIGLVTLTDIAVATTTERTQLKKILSEFPHLKKGTRNKTNFLLKLFQPAE